MQTLQALLMGAIQGISEFLPISSSAHIVFTSAIYKTVTGASFNSVTSEEIFFDILIHLASLFAVIIFFFNDFKQIITGFIEGIKTKNYSGCEFKMCVYLICATLVTCIIGFFIKDLAHSITENPAIVAGLLLVTGFVLFFSEKFKRAQKGHNLKNSLIIGLVQGLAVFPGLSRSGLTIGAGIFLGIPRVKAARFSFLLSAPVIILASMFYPMLEVNFAEIKTFNCTAILVGCIASFITGYLCIKFFMKFLEKFSIKYFAYYCWLIGAVMIYLSLKFN